MIYVIGGNGCLEDTFEKSIESCYQRSFTDLGSSTPWPPIFPSTGFGMMDVVPSNKFAEWTKIVLLYCDGVLFQGYNKNPYNHKGRDLFFRGSRIMRAHLKWIDQQYNFSAAKKIVLAGISAGGMATYMWIDYLRSIVNDPNKVYGIVDSGIFLDPEATIKFHEQAIPISSFYAKTSSNTVNNVQGGSSQNSNTTSSSNQRFINLAQITSAASLANSNGGGSGNLISAIEQLMKITNADERPPNKKCIDSLPNSTFDYKCLFSL